MRETVVLTGAAGQLGKCFALNLAKEGYRVLATDVNNLEALPSHPNIETAILDVSCETDVISLFKSLGQLYAVVNNAGIGVFTPFEDRTVEEFMAVTNVNSLGTFLLCREAIKKMKLQGCGKIVNIASMYGVISSDPRIYGVSGRNNSEVYSMTKAGIIQLSRYIAANYAHYNIQANSISPGGVFNEQSEDFLNAYISRNPTRKMAQPEQIFCTLRFLLSNSSNYVNGQNIIVDGGHSLW